MFDNRKAVHISTSVNTESTNTPSQITRWFHNQQIIASTGVL